MKTPNDEISPATLAAFERARARMAVAEIEELCAEVSGQLLEVEHMRCAWMVAPVAMMADLFTWWPCRGRGLPS